MRMGGGGISLCTKHQTLSLSLNVLGSRHSNGDLLGVHAVVRVPTGMDEVLSVERAEGVRIRVMVAAGLEEHV